MLSRIYYVYINPKIIADKKLPITTETLYRCLHSFQINSYCPLATIVMSSPISDESSLFTAEWSLSSKSVFLYMH